MKVFLSLTFLSLVISSASAGIHTPWKDFSDPTIMSASFERRFVDLPLEGEITNSEKLWANDYWPRKRGSINFRWNSVNPRGFKLESPDFNRARSMSSHEIASLAPSEKLDLLNGDYSFSLKEEVDEGASPQAPLWHGICNGWAPASVNHNEPLPKSLTNPDGIEISFGSSDIKALLSYYYAFHHKVETTHQMGKRCHVPFFDPNCSDDLNAGAFHLVLANRIGVLKESFIADIERGRQVWNHAINAYTSKVIQSQLPPADDSAPGTLSRVQIKTTMSYVLKIKENSWYPVLGTDSQINDVKHYEYYLELDAFGRIIGGEWISRDRPDFLWSMKKATSFQGKFSRLSELLND